MNENEAAVLVGRAKKGDANAFGELYSDISEEAYRFGLYYLKNVHDAADAVQSAALKAYKNIRQLRKPSGFRSWFFTIEANECRKILRESRRTVSADETIREIPDNSYEDMYISTELNEAMRILSEEDRMIVRLCIVEGFKSGEISSILGIKPSSVRSRLSRALHSLRAQLESEGE